MGSKSIREHVATKMKDKVKQFGWRMLQLQGFHMSHEEVLHLTAPSHHHEILKTAATIATIQGGNSYMTLRAPYTLDGVEKPTFDLTMRTHDGQEPPLRPRYPEWQPHCDIAIRKKATDWLEHYLKHTRMTATTCWVVDKLAEICETGHQVRFIWPAILHLTAKSGDEVVEKWVDKYGIRTVPKMVPQITPAFRKILTDTSEWCAQAVLLEEIKRVEYYQVVPSPDERYVFSLHLEGTEVVLPRIDPP